MKSGTCPKCDSTNVHHEINGIFVPNTLGTFIRTSGGTMGSRTDDHICTDCGYMERYVADDAKLKEIAEAWEKAG